MIFQKITKSDIELQKNLLFVALWTPKDEPKHDRKVLELPHISEYFESWGKRDDLGFFVFSNDGHSVGIIQARIKSSQNGKYSNYPEIAIAVLPEYCGEGVGSLLMDKLISEIGNNYDGLRLGVHPKNEVAIKLYEKFGFVVYETGNGGYLQMVRENKHNNSFQNGQNLIMYPIDL